MTLREQMAAHLQATVFNPNLLAESITYTPPGGAAITLVADVGPERTEEVLIGSEWVERRVRKIGICRDPAAASGGVAGPVRIEALVTYAGVDYSVEGAESEDADSAYLRCMRSGARRIGARQRQRG
jgi:hypothetical protein